jgi:hypothetical protein
MSLGSFRLVGWPRRGAREAVSRVLKHDPEPVDIVLRLGWLAQRDGTHTAVAGQGDDRQPCRTAPPG